VKDSCENGCCPAGDNYATPGDCGREGCVLGSCPNAEQACDIGTNFTQSKTLLDQLNAFFAKCGIEFEKAYLYLSGCDETPETETPAPSDNGGTPSTPPVDEGETPSTPPVTPSTPPVDEGDNENIDNLSFEEQVAVLVNEQRAANGLAPLTLNASLSNAARAKSQDISSTRAIPRLVSAMLRMAITGRRNSSAEIKPERTDGRRRRFFFCKALYFSRLMRYYR